MNLELTLQDPHDRSSRSFAISPSGAWIGRARGCEIALEDPDRFVSARHARLDYSDGQFWLTDQSTNGTFLNGAASRMVRGRRHPLRDGDRFRIGPFVFGASLTGTTEHGAPPVRSRADEGPTELAGALPASVDPLLVFDHAPATGASDTVLVRAPLGEPDPLASLLADLKEAKLAQAMSAPPDPGVTYRSEAEPPSGAVLRQMRSDRVASASPPPVLPPEPRSETTGGAPPERRKADMLAAVTEEVASLSPALCPRAETAEPPKVVEPPAASGGSGTPPEPRRRIDSATAAVAAFWCGLGIIPRDLDANELIAVMAELGAAFREAAEGFSVLLGREAQGRVKGVKDEPNPFGFGHAGLRRRLDTHPSPDAMPLDEAVRDVFRRNDERARAYREEVRAGVERVAQSLAASAIEKRFAGALKSRFPRARHAELWRLFRTFEKELTELAEARFHTELADRARGTGMSPRGPGV